jgi:hypothetical protein
MGNEKPDEQADECEVQGDFQCLHGLRDILFDSAPGISQGNAFEHDDASC